MIKKDFKEEPKVNRWMQHITDNGCTLSSLTPISLLNKHNGELLFALCDAHATDPQGDTLPNYIFIRGNACVIVVLVVNESTGEQRYVMIRQRRIGNGALNLEFPAGMLDRTVDSARDVAAKELHEETGLNILPQDLFELNATPLYSSAGASDEAIFYFGCIARLSSSDFSALEGKSTGNASEHEKITVTLRTREEAAEESLSLQARLGLYLFDDFLKNKRRA